jgi:hypothetical protein
VSSTATPAIPIIIPAAAIATIIAVSTVVPTGR